MSVSGDTVVVGAHGESSSTAGVNSIPDEGASRAGAAYVFVRSGNFWSQQAYLKASRVSAGDIFGLSVAVSGDTLVVGAYGDASSTTGVNSIPNNWASAAGAAYVFGRSADTWTQKAYLKSSKVKSHDRFGWSVAVGGDTVVVGAYGENSSSTGVNSAPNENAQQAGAAYIFSGFGPAVPTPLELWRQLHFGSPDNVGNAADDSDFDRDGLVNLMEWAVGSLPKQSNTWQSSLVRNGAVLEFTYARSLAAFNAGTGYAVEWSDSMIAGSWRTEGVAQSVVSTAGDVQTVRALLPPGTAHRYVRLRVSVP